MPNIPIVFCDTSRDLSILGINIANIGNIGTIIRQGDIFRSFNLLTPRDRLHMTEPRYTSPNIHQNTLITEASTHLVTNALYIHINTVMSAAMITPRYPLASIYSPLEILSPVLQVSTSQICLISRPKDLLELLDVSNITSS